jgi:hypothetical protein
MKCDIPLMSPVSLNRRHGRERLRGERGQTLLEFALILPLLLILIFGVIDLGKALGYKNDETNIANQAARLAVVSNGTNCQPCTGGQDIAGYVLSTAPRELRLGTGSITSPATVTFSFPNLTATTGYCKGDPVKVKVDAHYSFLSFLIGQNALPAGFDISSSATMRMETDYNVAAPIPAPTGFTPQGWTAGRPACP